MLFRKRNFSVRFCSMGSVATCKTTKNPYIISLFCALSLSNKKNGINGIADDFLFQVILHFFPITYSLNFPSLCPSIFCSSSIHIVCFSSLPPFMVFLRSYLYFLSISPLRPLLFCCKCTQPHLPNERIPIRLQHFFPSLLFIIFF